MAFETQGTILEIMPMKTVGQKNFQIQEFVVELYGDTDYPKPIPFQFIGKRANVLSEGNFNIGDEVKLAFDLDGRRWEGNDGVRYFNSNNVWEIQLIGSASKPKPKQTNGQQYSDQNPPPITDADLPFNDDIPF